MPQTFVPAGRAICQPRRSPPQYDLGLEPTEDELQGEIRRMWLGSPYWRQQYRSVEALLADPWRQMLFRRCARQALRARAAQQGAPTSIERP